MSEQKSIDDLKKELEAARADARAAALAPEVEALAKVKADIAKARAEAKESRRRAQELADDATFEDLEAEHAEPLYRVDTEGGMVVLKTPMLAKTRAFQAKVLGQKKLSPDDFIEFVKPCVVYPDEDGIETMLDLYPMLGSTLAGIASDLASAEAKLRGKK